MTYNNNINVLQAKSFGKDLIAIEKDGNTLKSVGFLGRFIRRLKKMIGKNSYEDCKITKIASTMKNMVDEHPSDEVGKKIVQDKFKEILGLKKIKPENKDVVQQIFFEVFPKESLKHDLLEKGFGALDRRSFDEIKELIDLLTDRELNEVLLKEDSLNPDNKDALPLISTAIMDISDPAKALSIVQELHARGIELNSKAVEHGEASTLYELALRKNYREVAEFIAAELGFPPNANVSIDAELQRINLMLDRLNDVKTEAEEERIFKDIDDLTEEGKLNNVFSLTTKDGSVENHTLLTAIYTTLDDDEKKWKYVSYLIEKGADLNMKIGEPKESIGALLCRDFIDELASFSPTQISNNVDIFGEYHADGEAGLKFELLEKAIHDQGDRKWDIISHLFDRNVDLNREIGPEDSKEKIGHLVLKDLVSEIDNVPTAQILSMIQDLKNYNLINLPVQIQDEKNILITTLLVEANKKLNKDGKSIVVKTLIEMGADPAFRPIIVSPLTGVNTQRPDQIP
ncbi:hypothetical protein [Parachlamydia acanthamoebae]|jgi:lambda repressor-like predicted transcriptional regulator|uniref:hypothetical protein n=1 Tax=Parachlamydia acanthamoebae TaxID=83552 RepID=UPI0024E1C920|nr:hypothetical protein [Parachlamydia acanthamoebae]